MNSIKRFEDLVAWQKARALTSAIYTATRDGIFARDFGLASQIQRAAVSVMSNIAEGYERNGTREYYQFLHIAKSSCAEVRCQLYVAFDVGYLSEEAFVQLLAQAEEVSRMLGGLCLSVGKRLKET